MAYAAIDLNQGIRSGTDDQIAETGYFSERMLNELLASESGINRHNKNQIHILYNILKQADRSVRVKGDTGKHIGILNERNSTMQMSTCFIMNGKHISTCILESMDIAVRLFNHQVGIEWLLRQAADSLDHWDSERDIRHKHTVHNVEMDPFGLGSVKHINILVE